MEILIIFLAIWFFFAWICYRMAEKRGRNTTLAAFAGFFLGLLAVLYYAIAGETEEKKRERIMRTVENEK